MIKNIIFLFFVVFVQVVCGGTELLFELPPSVTKDERSGLIKFDWKKNDPFDLHDFVMIRQGLMTPLRSLKEEVVCMQKDTEARMLKSGLSVCEEFQVEEVNIGVFSGAVARQVFKHKRGHLFFYRTYMLSDGEFVWVCSLTSSTKSDGDLVEEILHHAKRGDNRGEVDIETKTTVAPLQDSSTEAAVFFDLPPGVTKKEESGVFEFRWGKEPALGFHYFFIYRSYSLTPSSNLKEHVLETQKEREEVGVYAGGAMEGEPKVEEISIGVLSGVVAKQVFRNKNGLVYFHHDYILNDGLHIWCGSMTSTELSDESVVENILKGITVRKGEGVTY